MRPPTRLCVIGAGFISQVVHLPVFQSLDTCHIVGLADNRPAFCAEVARQYHIAAHVPDLRAAFALDADAYVIVLPRRAMGPAVKAALATGRAVLAEKPMGHTLAQARDLADAADRSGSALAVGFMKRHDPGVQLFKRTLAERVRDGSLGAIAHVAMRDYCATYAVPIPHHRVGARGRQARYDEWPSMPDGLPVEHQADFEQTVNVMSHDINLLRFVLGQPVMAASLRVRSGRMQMAVLDAGRFDVSLEVGRVDTGVWEQSMTVYFQRGSVRLDLPSPLARQSVARVMIRRAGGQEQLAIEPSRRTWAFRAQAEQFLDVVREKAAPLASGQDCVVDMAIIEDLWSKSIWSA